jgi:hypothetical protein
MLFAERYGVERGVDVRWVADPLDLDEWERRIDACTRFVYAEMPSNPSLSVFDIAAVADSPMRTASRSSSTPLWPRRPCCARSTTAPTSWCTRFPRA